VIEDDAPDAPMTAEDLRRLGARWITRIKDSEKREGRWIDQAGAAEKAYLGDRDSSFIGKCYDFNILHSNIETIVPAVFNSTPVPDIRERFRTGRGTPESAVAQIVARVIERAIMVQTDDGALEVEMEGLTQDALLAGRGIIRVKFDADVQEVEAADPMTGEPMARQIVTGERLIFECVSWRDYREGPAQRWRDVPWVAYRHSVPWEQVQRLRDPELKELLSTGGDQEEPEPDGDVDTHIWEVWDKDTRRVLMIVAHSGEVLSIMDDPMGLPEFFPQPSPVEPITATGMRVPVAPFSVYKALADELELITQRIKHITSGLKVRGLFVGEAGDIETLAQADDNTLIPVANLEAMAQTGGLDKAISWWPVDKAIMVLRELYAAREATKAMIYEVTGISDIVRGQGKASETATAQEIKSQWGSLRIRKLQKMIERAARDLFVICAELICTKFSPETLQKMSGIQLPPEAMTLLQAPLDHYRIDVESDSTVRADLTRRKGEMGEFLNATASFFSTMAPLVQATPVMAGPVSAMYAAFARQFSLGQQAEAAIEDMAEMAAQAGQAQQQQGPSPEELKAEVENRKLDIEEKRLTLDERKAEIDALETVARVG